MTRRRRRTGEIDLRLQRLLEAGRGHYEAREFVQAEPYLRQVAEALPNYADVQNMLGVTYFQQEKYELARQAFEKALEGHPGYTEAALNLAVTYNELGSYAKGQKLHEGMAAVCTEDGGLDPFVLGKIANMHAEIAQAYADYRQYDDAARQYREALRLCPGFADLRTHLGDVLRAGGDLEAAETEYRRAKQDNPNYAPARVNLGTALFIQGRRGEALAEWEAALELDPNNRIARTSLRMVRQDQTGEEPTLEPPDDAEPRPEPPLSNDEQRIIDSLGEALDRQQRKEKTEEIGRDRDDDS